MNNREDKPVVQQGGDTPLHRLVARYRRSHSDKLGPEDIAVVLREAIERSIFGPGRALRQDELAEVFGVSKIPIREALRTLEAYGFVELPHNRGAVVKELTVGQIRDVFELRLLIEPHLIRLALPSLGAADLDAAEALIDAMDHETNTWSWGELNVRFHRILYEQAQRPLAMRLLAMLEGHEQRYSVMQLSLAGLNRSSNEDHREILAACRRGDADEAARLTAVHVAEVKDIVIGLYENTGFMQAMPASSGWG